MTEVLFIATARPQLNALDEVAGELRLHHNATVRLATYFEPDELAEAHNVEEIRRIQLHLSGIGGRSVRRFSPRWFWVVARNPVRRLRLRRSDSVLRPWLLGQDDPWLRKQAEAADVLVALDINAVYCVWRLAQVNTKAKAVRGLYEAIEAMKGGHVPDLAELAETGEETRDRPTVGARAAVVSDPGPDAAEAEPGPDSLESPSSPPRT